MSSVLLTHLLSQLGGDVIQDQLVMGKHQKLLPPSFQHVSDVLPEEANTKPRSGAITMGRQTHTRTSARAQKLDRLLLSVLNFKRMGRGDPSPAERGCLHNGLQLGFACVVVEDEEGFLLLPFLKER